MVVIHKNPSLLRHKLVKAEPLGASKQSQPRVAFGVNLVEFDDDIPILQEKHLDAYCKRLAEKARAEKERVNTSRHPPPLGPPLAPLAGPSPKHTKIPKIIIRTPTNEHGEKRRGDRTQDNSHHQSPIVFLASSDEEEEVNRAPILSKKQQLREETPPPSPLGRRTSSTSISSNKTKLIPPRDTREAKKTSSNRSTPASNKSNHISQDRLDKIAQDLSSDLSDDDNNGVCDQVLDEDPMVPEESVCESSIDKLILKGPEEDEFRQYDNDENDEDESTISKNMKKIRTEGTKAPAPPRPPLIQQPFSHQTNRKDKSSTLAQPPANQPTPAKQFKASPKVEPPKDLAPEDLERLIGQKNWHLIYTEVDRNLNTFKSNETARTVMKKAAIACLDNDETYELINLMKLVFEFEYPEDTSFWEMLIGKLKRKVNPQTTEYRFKCEVDPKYVINNYNLVLQEIYKHFHSSSRMSNVKISFHLASYLAIWGYEKESTPTRQISVPTTVLIQPMPPANVDIKCVPSQTNQDPTTSYDVSLVKTANGKTHFKIKTLRRESLVSGYSPKFQI